VGANKKILGGSARLRALPFFGAVGVVRTVMLRLLYMFALLVLCAAGPAFAQSDSLKEAWRQTKARYAVGKYAEAASWAKKRPSI
jgi:hypothetical protein